MEKQSIQELLEFSILNIDKPAGPTSFSVSDFVRRKLEKIRIRKTSHFGTLDPQVTGVLPIALNRACKLTGFFLGHNKEYVGIMHIHKDNNIKAIQEIINKNFLGKIKQTPPKKSRVKRQEREREILSFELLEQKEKDILFKTNVQGGTYIRKLISDLGEFIGGAHMLELRRTKAGVFSEEDNEFSNLYDFEKSVEEFIKGNEANLKKILIPAETAIKKVMPIIQVNEKIIKSLLTGKPLFKNDLKKLPETDLFAVFCKEKFIGIYKKSSEGNIVARAEFVKN